MIRSRLHALTRALLAIGLCTSLSVSAQDILIRNANVHTASNSGSLKNTDVLVRGGKIAAIGSNLAAVAGVREIAADGKPLTPALFGGISDIGVEEVSLESATVDSAVRLPVDQPVRPEFDVTLAYNPDSILVPVARIEGIGFTVLGATGGGSFVAGQGGVIRLDGSVDPVGPRALFVLLGSGASKLSGSSRAAQWMLLDQLVAETRSRSTSDGAHALMTEAGRTTLAKFLAGEGRIVVSVDRAADIRQLLRWSDRQRVKVAIVGGAEAWKLANEIARSKVPVFVDGLAALPGNFDQLGSTLENAARLHKAGVAVSFAQSGDASHNARKLRQHAGNAVAHGLAWEDALAALTRIPAEVFGVSDRIGTIEVGKSADLVLWEGDPLDIAHFAEQVWLGGHGQPMRSRQTELRDRYLKPATTMPRAYTH